MIKFTKTESLVVEALKKNPLSSFELEEVIDMNKEFSKDYISGLISALNKKAGRKIVSGKNVSGEYKYYLVEGSIEYKILGQIDKLSEEITHLKNIIESKGVGTSLFHKSMKAVGFMVIILCIGVAIGGYITQHITSRNNIKTDIGDSGIVISKNETTGK